MTDYFEEGQLELFAPPAREGATWELTVPEQRRLLEILAKPAAPTSAFMEAMHDGGCWHKADDMCFFCP